MYTSNTFAFRESKNTISFCGLGLDDFTFIKKKKLTLALTGPLSCPAESGCSTYRV